MQTERELGWTDENGTLWFGTRDAAQLIGKTKRYIDFLRDNDRMPPYVRGGYRNYQRCWRPDQLYTWASEWHSQQGPNDTEYDSKQAAKVLGVSIPRLHRITIPGRILRARGGYGKAYLYAKGDIRLLARNRREVVSESEAAKILGVRRQALASRRDRGKAISACWREEGRMVYYLEAINRIADHHASGKIRKSVTLAKEAL